jgi:hypothetical protein
MTPNKGYIGSWVPTHGGLWGSLAPGYRVPTPGYGVHNPGYEVRNPGYQVLNQVLRPLICVSWVGTHYP